MSYVKYQEDDIKIINHRAQLRGENEIRYRKNIIRYYDCKYCNKLFTSKSDLFDHIKNIHNIVRPLIIINEKIVGDSTILQYVQSAKIILYGYEDTIIVGKTAINQEDDDEIDITNILKSELRIHSQCEIYFKDMCVTVELHPICIESNLSMKRVIDKWQLATSLNKPLDSTLLKGFEGSDLIFIQGMYNYFLACTAKHYKAKRYDDAFALLSQFHDLSGIGQCALKAISFRRNWIENLRLLTENQTDVFSTASEYFSCDSSSFEYENEIGSNQLFVEEGTKISLELITLFQKRKFTEVNEKLSEIGDIDYLDDMNLAEQLYLLKARMAIIDGDISLASKLYEKIITPAFKEDCGRFLKKEGKI